MKFVSSLTSFLSEKKNRVWRITALIFFIFFIISLLMYLLMPVMVKLVLKHKIEEIETERHISIEMNDLDIKTTHFFHYELEASQINLIQDNCPDYFLHIKDFHVEFRPKWQWPIDIAVTNMEMDTMKVQFIERKDYSNFSFLRNKQTDSNDSTSSKNDYGQKIVRYMRTLTGYIPEHLMNKSTSIYTEFDSVLVDYQIDSLQVLDGLLFGQLKILTAAATHEWEIVGRVNAARQDYYGLLTLQDSNQQRGELPFLSKLVKISTSFQQLSFGLHIQEDQSGLLAFSFRGKVNQWALYHPKLSDEVITADSASFLLRAKISNQTIEIDSSSVLVWETLSVNPYLFYDNKGKGRLKFEIKQPATDAVKMKNSLPEQIFSVLPRLNLEGKISFYLTFDCDFNQVDSLKFDFGIRSSDLRISPETVDYLRQFNIPFSYTAYDRNAPVRVISMDTLNPGFCKFREIPAFIRSAILVSEDPSFFQHNGFIKSAFRESMVANIKKGRFARGGSTLSMQLVKNLFLNKKKVYSRKIEEIFIVWLIENHQLMSKERMFEIYVNIIEWGPCVYGLKEASQFYFDKKPQELTLAESLYLASLIRSPKWYASTLEPDGALTKSRREEITFLARRLSDKNMISPEEFTNFNPNVMTKISEDKILKFGLKCNCLEKEQ